MGFEVSATDAQAIDAQPAESGTSSQPTTTQPPKARPPRDPAQAEAAAKRAAVRRLLSKAKDAKSTEELWQKLSEAKDGKGAAKPARTVEAKASEVVPLKSPEEAARDAEAKLVQAREQVAMVIAGLREVVAKTPYEIDDQRATILAVGLAPWAAENGEKLSPKAMAIGALATWLVPPTAQLAVQAGRTWWEKRKAATK